MALAVLGACVAAVVLVFGFATTASTPAVRLLGRAPAGERISFTLLLRLPGSARLRRELTAIENPRSPQFHHFLDVRSFGARYGISTKEMRALARSLVRNGLRITGSYPQRTALALSGTVADVSRLLHVGIGSYTDSAGRRWHAPLGSPTVPAALAPVVSGVTGLDTQPTWRAHDVPAGGLTSQEVASAYDIAPLRALGVLGQGQTIAVISFSDYDRSDPATFAGQFQITSPAPRVIPVAYLKLHPRR